MRAVARVRQVRRDVVAAIENGVCKERLARAVCQEALRLGPGIASQVSINSLWKDNVSLTLTSQYRAGRSLGCPSLRQSITTRGQ